MPRAVSGLLAALAAAAGLACGAGDAPRPHVVLISLDTLRADHVGAYGYGRPTTPHLDGFARDAFLFERAYSSSSHTLPAHASMLTGLEPSHHGLLADDDVLGRGVGTLAESLGRAGYRTAGFVNGGYLHEKFGLARGFDHYDFVAGQRPRADRSGTGRNAGETVEAVGAWLDATGESEPMEEPLFLFVHLFDVHSDWGRLPYEAPGAERARFESPRPEDGAFDPGDESASVHMLRLNDRGAALTDAELDWMVSLYDAGIAYTDAQVERLFTLLRDRGILEDSIVIVTADHGEEFQEHGRLLHEQVYEELIRVPLLLRVPGRGAGRIGAIVRHVDLLPTVLELVGLPTPENVAGRSLVPLLEGREEPARVVVARNQQGTQVAVSDGRFKLVAEPAAGRARLFDLERDPGETGRGPAPSRAEIARLQELRRAHLDAVQVESAATSAPLDPEIAESLRALGYVGDSEPEPQGR